MDARGNTGQNTGYKKPASLNSHEVVEHIRAETKQAQKIFCTKKRKVNSLEISTEINH